MGSYSAHSEARAGGRVYDPPALVLSPLSVTFLWKSLRLSDNLQSWLSATPYGFTLITRVCHWQTPLMFVARSPANQKLLKFEGSVWAPM
jgi:hypothetical protein